MKKNRYAVKSTGAKGNSALSAAFGQSRALVVGINSYAEGIRNLQTAVSDATSIAETLAKDHGYRVDLMCDGQATFSNIRNHLCSLSNEIGEKDRFLFYFAGHGIALDNDDGPSGYLLLHDAEPSDSNSYMPMTTLHDEISKLACRHTLIVLDCCFAGAFRWSSTRDLAPVPEIIYEERFARYLQDPAGQVITSAAYDQKALDVVIGEPLGLRDKGSEHSPFAHALLKGLSGDADLIPKGKGDGVITATELYLYLRQCVELEGVYRQTPGLWPLRWHDKGEYVFLVPNHELNLPPAPQLRQDNNPWRGLDSYTETEKNLFFGRSALTDKLVERVKQMALTIVVGPSGTGKSSLVSAGLLPGLRPSSEFWNILPILRPGIAPVNALQELFCSELDVHAGGKSKNLDPETSPGYLNNWFATNPNVHVLLVIDQFEELITHCEDKQERLDFVQLLERLTKLHGRFFHIVLVIRSDFEPHFSRLFPSSWQNSRFYIPPMEHDQLREAIEGPANLRAIYFKPSQLVNDLVNEVVQTPGALSLLSFAMSEMYKNFVDRRSDDRSITDEDYKSIGSAVVAMQTKATTLYRSFDAKHRETIKRIMLRMVSLEGGELARRRIPISELEFVDEDENVRIKNVLSEGLLPHRLLVTAKVGGQACIEPAHDQLIRGWDVILGWLDEPGIRQQMLYLRRLNVSSARWARSRSDTGKPNEILWSKPGEALELQAFVDKTPNVLNVDEKQFADESIELFKKTRYKSLGLIATTVSILALLSFVIINVVNDRKSARENEAEARQNAVIAQQLAELNAKHSELNAYNGRLGSVNDFIETDSTRALEYLENPDYFPLELRDFVWGYYHKSIDRYLYSIKGHRNSINAVAFSKNDEYLVFGGSDKTVRLWNFVTKDGRLLGKHASSINAIAISPNSELVASGDTDNVLRLWNLRTNNHQSLLTGEEQDQVNTVTFSDDENYLIAGTRNGKLYIWNLGNLDSPLPIQAHRHGIRSVAFSDSRTLVASAGQDKSIRLWNAQTGERDRQLGEHDETVNSIAFSPDEKTLVSSSNDQTIRIWNLESGPSYTEFPSQDRPVDSIVMSPDGKTIVAASQSTKIVQFWDVASRRPQFTWTHPEYVNSIAFSTDGKILAVGTGLSHAPVVELWDSDMELGKGELSGREGQVYTGDTYAVAISSDGATIATGGEDYRFRVWNSATREVRCTTEYIYNSIRSMVFSTDGTTLITGGWGHEIRFWDPKTCKELPVDFDKQNQSILSISYSKELNKFASGARDGAIMLWDPKSPTPVSLQPANSISVYSVAYSPDGKTIASGDSDSFVRIWDVATKTELYSNERHTQPVKAVAFSPDGFLLASASDDSDIHLWNANTGDYVKTLTGHVGEIYALAYSPDGKTLASAGSNKLIRFWDAVTGESRAVFEGHTKAIRSLVFSQNSKMLISGGDDTVRLWTADTRIKDTH